MQVGIIDKNAQIGKACPADFKRAAKIACRTKFEDATYVFPNTREFDLPYICMDLVYQYSLLVDGFGKFTYIFICHLSPIWIVWFLKLGWHWFFQTGLHPYQDITVVKKVNYQNSWVEAAWTLGTAVEAVSSSSPPSTANLWAFHDLWAE